MFKTILNYNVSTTKRTYGFKYNCKTSQLRRTRVLDNYAVQQWEYFLLHLINSAEAEVTTKSISASMMKVFQQDLLSQRGREGARLTESCFQFLLMDTKCTASFKLSLSFKIQTLTRNTFPILYSYDHHLLSLTIFSAYYSQLVDYVLM
ncbi:transcription factor-related protein [Artemisia annua]|uniref:RNA polymerase II transcription factor B subunit 2 n=1 Tax=Artemisia annua TaxID=35608 RepID=A0A2U1L2R2_ARTAN|nr:transcription factor-related protein [Artemisia annua]